MRVKTLICVIYLVCLCRSQAGPNIIHLMVDDLGYADLAVMGHPYVKTPNIDQLFSEGAQVDTYYSCSPVCSPSRAAVLTGRNPVPVWNYFSTRQNNERWGQPDHVDYSGPTIAKSLATAGYKTAHIGKWHLGNMPPSAYGFHVDRAAGQYWTYNNNFFVNSTALIRDEVDAFIDRVGDDPFYLQYWFESVHAPVVASAAAMEPYDDMEIDFSQFPQKMQDYYAEQGDGAESKLKRHMAKITELDEAVGALMAKLESTGKINNTFILFTSDNGPEWYGIQAASITGSGSAGHLRGRKRSLYEGGIRMPCCLWMPTRIAPQVHRGAAMSQKDFFRTTLELAGAEVPEGVEGESLFSLLSSDERQTDLIWRFEGPIWGPEENKSPPFVIRRGPWKYLTDRDNSIEELYHIPTDPSEEHDLSLAEPTKVVELRLALNAWIEENVPNIPTFFIEQQTPGDGVVTLDARAKGANLLWHDWYRDGTLVSSGRPSRYEATEPGTYHCVVSNSYGTAQSIDFVISSIPSGLTEPTPSMTFDADGCGVIHTPDYVWTRQGYFSFGSTEFEVQQSTNLETWLQVPRPSFWMMEGKICIPRDEHAECMFYRVLPK